MSALDRVPPARSADRQYAQDRAESAGWRGSRRPARRERSPARGTCARPSRWGSRAISPSRCCASSCSTPSPAWGDEVHDVLIVDDEPDLVELIARMLQSVGESVPSDQGVRRRRGAGAAAQREGRPGAAGCADAGGGWHGGARGDEERSHAGRDPGDRHQRAASGDVAGDEDGLFLQLTRAVQPLHDRDAQLPSGAD